jgi:hypothetical protein
MLDRIPWVYVEVTVGLAACVVVGASFGIVGTLLRLAGERRAEDR